MADNQEIELGGRLQDQNSQTDDFDSALSTISEEEKAAAADSAKPAEGAKTQEQLDTEAAEAKKREDEAKAAAADSAKTAEGAKTQEQLDAEAAEAKKREDEAKAAAAEKTVVIPESIKKHFPEAASLDDVAVKIGDVLSQLKEATDSNEEMVTLLNNDPALLEMLKEVKKGVPSEEALRKYFELSEGENVPDPAAEPEKYKEFKKRQLDRKVRMEAEQKQLQAQSDVSKQMEARAQSLAKTFREKNKTMDDASFEKFAGFIHDLVRGNAKTGIPDNFFDVFHRAYAFDDLMKQKVDEITRTFEQKLIDQRNDIIRKLKTGESIGDGLPVFRSVKSSEQKTVDEFTPLEESFASDNRIPIV